MDFSAIIGLALAILGVIVFASAGIRKLWNRLKDDPCEKKSAHLAPSAKTIPPRKPLEPAAHNAKTTQMRELAQKDYDLVSVK